jgi:hypothetical protein
MADTYEAPAIESRTEITPALIGAILISANLDADV